MGGGAFLLLSAGKDDQGSLNAGTTSATPDPTLTLSRGEVERIDRLLGDIHEWCHVAYSASTQELYRAWDAGERLPGEARSVITLARKKPDAHYSTVGVSRSMSDVLTDAATQLDPVACNENPTVSLGVQSSDQEKAFALLNRESLR